MESCYQTGSCIAFRQKTSTGKMKVSDWTLLQYWNRQDMLVRVIYFFDISENAGSLD